MTPNKAVYVKCTLSRGGFPTECVFTLKTSKGNFCGTASIQYCFREDLRRVEKELPVGEEVQGWVVGIMVGEPDGGFVRVYLPDSAVYSVAADSIKVPTGAQSGVPVQS